MFYKQIEYTDLQDKINKSSTESIYLVPGLTSVRKGLILD